MSKKINVLLSLTSGLLLVLSFPPLNFYPLAWFALVPFLYCLSGKRLKESFSLGMICGLVYFLGTVYWVSHSMYIYGNLPIAATLSVLILLCIYLALYVGVFAGLFAFLTERSRLPACFFAPVIWVSLEYLRSYALTGFPWSLVGYSQAGFLTFIQFVDITGIYGVTFLIVAVNGMLYDVFQYRSQKLVRSNGWRVILGVLFTLVLFITALLYGYYRLDQDSSDKTIQVSVVQGNIPQDQKWDLRFRKDVIKKYHRLTEQVSEKHPELIVWPESALPFTFGYNKPLTNETIQFQKKLNTYLLLGSVIIKESDVNKRRLSNSAILLSPEGETLATYDKMHLVPFGEYVPLKEIFPFIDKIVVAIGDFVPGLDHVVMQTPFAKIGNVICYEIIFPDLVRAFVRKGANLLVTITNDAWFGRTSAPYQHFSMAVFRAIENRIPVVRSANTGISGFIDEKGRIISQSDIFVEAALTAEIAINDKTTFYTQYGDILVYVCLLSLFLLIVDNFVSRKR